MPTVARSPSARAHSCSFVYLRLSGYILVPSRGGHSWTPAGAGPLVAKHSRAHLARLAPAGPRIGAPAVQAEVQAVAPAPGFAGSLGPVPRRTTRTQGL